MAVATINNVRVKDLELVAYETSKIMIDKGYMTNVKQEDDAYVTYVFKDRFIKDIIGTPTAVKCIFKQFDDRIEVEIKTTFVTVNGTNIFKEVLGVATILPLLNKSKQIIEIKKELKKASLIAINKFKEGK